MKKRVDIEEGTIFALLIFTLLAMIVPGKGPDSIIIAMLSIATFLFGILGAYIMQNRHKRIEGLRSTLRENDGLFVNIYQLSHSLGVKVQKRIQKLIDDYYIETIDYYGTKEIVRKNSWITVPLKIEHETSEIDGNWAEMEKIK